MAKKPIAIDALGGRLELTSIWTLSSISVNTTITTYTDRTSYDVTTGSAVAITLGGPLGSPEAGLRISFRRNGANTVTVNSTANINGASSVVMAVDMAVMELEWQGSTWFIV